MKFCGNIIVLNLDFFYLLSKCNRRANILGLNWVVPEIVVTVFSAGPNITFLPPQFDLHNWKLFFFQHFLDKVLDPIEQFIEDLITERCYEGQPYVKIKSKTELKLEKAHQEREMYSHT